MTASVYSTRPVFSSLPTRIAAARATASLYLVDGEELVRDYVSSEQQRITTTLCLPARVETPIQKTLEANRTSSRVVRARWAAKHPKHLKSGPVICLPAPASDKPLTLIEDVQTTIRSIHQWDGSRRNLSTRPDLWVARSTQGDVLLYQTRPGKYAPPVQLGVVGWLGEGGYTPAPTTRIEQALTLQKTHQQAA